MHKRKASLLAKKQIKCMYMFLQKHICIARAAREKPKKGV